MSTPGPDQQVRRCAGCGAAAAILVEAWAAGESWFAGASAQPAPTVIHKGVFRCQACGACLRWARFGCLQTGVAVVLGGWALLMSLGTLLFLAQLASGASFDEAGGALMCTGLGTAGAVLGLLVTIRPVLAQRRWPVVDAPRPEPRLLSRGPTRRRCECGASAPATRVVQERLKLMPTGRVHEHNCVECGATFNVPDNLAIVFSILACALVSGAGALMTLHPPGSAVGAAEQNRWFGVGLLAIGVLSWAVPILMFRKRAAHPLALATKL